MVQSEQTPRTTYSDPRFRSSDATFGEDRGDIVLPVTESGKWDAGSGNGRTKGAVPHSADPRHRQPLGGTSVFRPLTGGSKNAHLIPFAVLVVLAVLFVVWETAFRRLLPTMTIGWHHALLTLWAGVVTAVACTGVWVVMNRQQRSLSETAARLTHLLESYRNSDAKHVKFENRHLARCWKVLDCSRTSCPMHGVSGERCWQVVALDPKASERGAPRINIQKCHDCKVYMQSCPDALTELGEGFNNLMYLLDWEAQRVDRMRAQLVEKEKMVAIGQMASGIAHEVGNPLSSISSIVQMVRRSEPSDRVAAQLELIETHIRRISHTVRQLVTLARPGSQRWELVDIGQTVQDAIQLIGFDRRARNVEITCEPPDSIPSTYALRGELQQVFINLGLNALDAMPEGGRLDVTISARPREVIVQFADTGFGIDESVGRHIFEPFFTTKEAGEGTGLGLSVSYGIMRKHGGRIDFSTTPGKGTTFDVRIPVWDKPPDEH